MAKLTDVQKEIIDHCKSLHTQYGTPAALDYVGKFLKFQKTRTLESLERKGVIEWVNHTGSQISRFGEMQSYWQLTEEALNA